MSDDDIQEMTEQIELTKFLTTKQVSDIVALAVRKAPTGNYQAKLEITVLMDELRKRGLQLENKFSIEGSKWTCPKCSREMMGVARCPCGYVNEKIIPKGTYEFLYEVDLGGVFGVCGNYGCGHPIRFLEHIMHVETGKNYIVGNVCVGHILGEHDLIKIAISLLARCSHIVEKQNKSQRCDEICGQVLREVVQIDSKHWFTKAEYLFLEAIKGSQSKLTLKKAEEFKAKWTPEAIVQLKKDVEQRDIEEKKGPLEKSAEREKWLVFLEYEKRRRKGRDSDFIDNCLSATKNQGQPYPGQRNALRGEFERFWRILEGDTEVLKGLPVLVCYIAEKMMKHLKTCQTDFHISLLEQVLDKKELTERQFMALKEGCKRCNWKLD
jgi:hypothetical protein